ncbi:MAG: 50S ribosomal protein L16 [Nanoarchaeota archaeon]|jgi:large subunit ribosomal protein L10e|nr:50S ribosomal protein L16 [Nanoarchaeota archaeon]
MATLRKANAYSKRAVTPFTRISKRRQKSFIKVVPPQKIVKFHMGKITAYNEGKLPHVLTVCTTEPIQIRHNAFEACRQFINKKMDKETNGQYMFEVIPYPHHIQREHKMLTGAGADRMSSGMQLSFGKSIGKAALLKRDAKIFMIALPHARYLPFARKVLKQIRSKMPCQIRTDYELLTELPKI